MNRADCPFCQPLPTERILAESDTFIAILDGSVRIVNWVYSQTLGCHGLTWVRMDELQALPADWNQTLNRLL